MKGHPAKKRNKYIWILLFVFVLFLIYLFNFKKDDIHDELNVVREHLRHYRDELHAHHRDEQLEHHEEIAELKEQNEALIKHHYEEMTELKEQTEQHHKELSKLNVRKIDVVVDDAKDKTGDEIRAGMQHAFQAYMRDAWKSDEYKPVSKHGVNTFGGKGLTIIDSLDTLWLMGLKDEYAKAKEFVEKDFHFDGHINVFENNIRVLGGLLAAHALTNEQIFLVKAQEVGEVLLGAFRNRIPCGIIDTNGYCGSQSWAGGRSVNAEVGTLSLEFETLSHLTGDSRWSEKIRGINEYWQEHQHGLLQMYIDPKTEKMSGPRTIGGGIDSTYEYLIKLKLMNGDKLAGELYDKFEREIAENMVVTHGKHTFAKASGSNRLEHLGCFGGGMLILGQRYINEGLAFAETCAEMYTSTTSGLACDSVTIELNGDIKCENDIYLLRPEVVESIFYAWRQTHDQKWREYARKIWRALHKNCEVETGGFTDVKYVTRSTPEKMDKQESWFLAETLKYLWLTFQSDDVLPLDEYVFNTEAHPLQIY
tara:strand:+ start:2116 stop:3723 length:1608 start_codon:yes stop_codon:yes gene_type:complete